MAVFFDRPDWLAGEDAGRHYFQAEVKATLSRWALGVILRSSPLTFSENANPGRMIYIAFRFKNGIEIGLMEDLPPMDTVPDVAMYVKLDLHRGHKLGPPAAGGGDLTFGRLLPIIKAMKTRTCRDFFNGRIHLPGRAGQSFSRS